MSINNSAFEALKVYLIKNHGAKLASGGKEITKKCHICGDSRDPSSRHMYIGLRDGAIVYNCFKCNSKGIVDRQFLRDIDCDDLDLISLCNRNCDFNTRSSFNDSVEQKLGFIDPVLPYHDTPGNRKKLAYLQDRMGIDFKDKLYVHKIVLNLEEFLQDNKIVMRTRDPIVMHELSEFFVGFVSYRTRYVNLRRLVPEEKVHPSIRSRYIKYNIFDLDVGDYYILPAAITPGIDLDIHIAEGPFDIIGVKNSFIPEGPNNIFAAIGGKSYLAIVKFLIMKYGFTKFTLHIYADNDVDNYEIEKISNYLKPYRNMIILHRNTMPGQKDFGVSRDLIIDSFQQI